MCVLGSGIREGVCAERHIFGLSLGLNHMALLVIKGTYFSQCRNVVKLLVAGLGTSAQTEIETNSILRQFFFFT